MSANRLVLLSVLFLTAACATPNRTGASPVGTAAEASAASAHARPGYLAIPMDGRLIVLRHDDRELAAFEKTRELGKSVSRIGAGPNGMTLRAPDTDTIDGYLLARPGFATRVVEGRIWVFAADSAEWKDFLAHGELAKSVTRVGAGPNGATVKAPDTKTLEAWLAAL